MGTYERVAILGGADPIDPLEPNNRLRHVAVGGLLTCVAVWACVAVAGVFHSSVKMPWPAAIFAGLLIAGVIFFIDVLITCTPLKEDRARYRARVVLIRGMISLAMGLVISHATIVFMYEDTLAQIVSAKNEAVAQADAKRIRAHSQWAAAIAAAQGQVAADRKLIQGADSSFSRAQAELDRSRRAWLNDRLCVNGTQRAADGDWCGNGNVANPLRKAYEQLNRKFPAQQRAHNQAVSSLSAAITSLNNTITADRSKLSAEIRGGIRADLANTGLAAQSEALWTLLRGDVFVWLWPVFFVVVDMAVALMRGILPESDFDRRRRRDREQDDAVNAEAKASPVWREVAHHAAISRAKVAMARNGVIADQEIASLQSRRGSSVQQPGQQPLLPQRRSRRNKLAWTASVSASATLTLVLTFTASLSEGPGQPPSVELSGIGGQTIHLHRGEKLTIPVAAISGNAPVTAVYTASQAWPGNTPISDEVKFTSTGTITGKPVLSLRVPRSDRQLALSGALHLAFRSQGEWTPYPATFNAETDTMVASLTHFSTWRFWRSDWGTDLGRITRTVAAWSGRRAVDLPSCRSRRGPPGWYHSNVGIENTPALAVRSCIEGHAGGVLEVQLVNNRPYGLILDYGSNTVKWGWHATPRTLTDTLRDAVGDHAARAAGGLYLPPLSRASVGIMNPGRRTDHGFAITPGTATILGDVLDMSLGSLVSGTASAAAVRWAENVVATAVSGPACAGAATGNTHGSVPGRSGVMHLLTRTVPGCLRQLLTIAARQGRAQRVGIADTATRRLSDAAARLEKLVSGRQWVTIESELARTLDFSCDGKSVPRPKLGFGFSVISHHAHNRRAAPPPLQ